MAGVPFFRRYKNELVLGGILFGLLVSMSSQVTTAEGASLTRHVLQQVLSPFLRSADAVSGAVQRVFYDYADFRFVVRENARLKEELRHARIRALQNASMASSNRMLHELLDYRKSLPIPTMAAHVVARDVTDPYRSIIIEKGSMDGIRLNMAVICPEGLVGRVRETSAHSSQIQLVTDTQSALAVMLLPDRVTALAVGEGDGYLTLKYIPPEGKIQMGDVAVSSGYEGIYPEGFPLGEVESIHAIEGKELEREVRVKPSVRFRNLTELLVVMKRPGKDFP